MGFANENGNGMYMPVAPAYGYGGMGGGFGNGLNGDGWWILILLLALGGNWGGNGFGNGGMSYPFFAMNTNNDVQRGFDQSAVMSGINTLNSNVQNGFAGVNQNLCNSTANITQAVTSGFASAEIANNARQMADMNQNFATQTAITGSINTLQSQLAQCCCDNRLATANLTSTILAENCADRAAISDALRDVITNQNAGVQRIIDTMCQNKIDDLQRELSEKNTQIAMLNLKSDNLANTDAIIANNEAQTSILRQVIAPTPVPTYPAQYSFPNNVYNAGWNNGCCGN